MQPKMAEKSDVRKELTIIWKTEKAPLGSKRVSSVFSLLGAKWQLHMVTLTCYPITVYLHRIGGTRPSKDFSLQSSIQSVKKGYNFRSSGVTATISHSSTQLWCSKLEEVTRKTLDWIIDAEVTVVCVLTGITSDFLNETVSFRNDACDVSRGLESLSCDLSKMLDDETMSDVKLSCNDRTIFAHKTILAARSDVFAAMFRNKMAESETGVVNLSAIDPVFELFVKYMYSGKVLDLSENSVSGLYEAADMYAVHELKNECSRWICRNLTEENCFGFLILADAHGDQAMKDAVLGYFLKNMELLNSETWNSFSEQHPKLSNCVYQKCFSEKFFKTDS